MNPTAYPLSQIPNRTPSSNGKLFDFYHNLLAESKYIFFQANDTVYNNELLSPAAFSLVEGATATFTGVALASKFIMGTFSDIGLLMVVLTLWSPVIDFDKLLKTTFDALENTTGGSAASVPIKITSSDACTTGTDFVLESYNYLRQLSKLLNEAFSSVLIPFILEGVFTYAINFSDILFLGKLSQGIVVFSFYLIFFLILQTSSRICQKVKKMQ